MAYRFWDLANDRHKTNYERKKGFWNVHVRRIERRPKQKNATKRKCKKRKVYTYHSLTSIVEVGVRTERGQSWRGSTRYVNISHVWDCKNLHLRISRIIEWCVVAYLVPAAVTDETKLEERNKFCFAGRKEILQTWNFLLPAFQD